MSFIFPHIVYAAPGSLAELALVIRGLVNAIVPVLIALAFVLFLWGIAQTVLHADDAGARKEGRKKMVYAGVSLFVVVSLWGILALVLSAFDIPLGGGASVSLHV